MKTLIFDFAGVLMNLNIERDTRSLLRAGLPDWKGCMEKGERRTILLDFLNGLMSWEEFLPAIRPFCKPDVTEEEIFNAMNDVLDDVPASRLEWIRSLRSRYRVVLLSNINEQSWSICKERIAVTGFSLEDCFDAVYLSFEMQLAKPDERIYRAVLSDQGILAEDALYFDDTAENIAAAQNLGISSILVPMNGLESLVLEL